MKRIFSLLIVFVFCVGICLIPAKATNAVVDYKTRKDFDWGMNHHEGQYRSYRWEYMEEQIHLSAKAGCTMIRIGGDITGDLTYQDQLVGLCNKYGMKVIMVFKPSQIMGLEYITLACKALAERYNGKNGRGFVDYIQVWNETDAILIKAKFGTGGPLGKVFEDYYTIPVDGAADLPEYTEYFRAAAKGIHEADSDTQFMINFCGQHWACLVWYLKAGVDIDVIGWDTYGQSTNHQEATEMFKRDCDELYDEIISKYNIPVIICESNTSRDLIFDIEETKKIENYETLFNMMKIAYSYDWIKGFTIYELFDEPYLEDGEKSWGMVECDSNGIIGEEKPVYWELQRLLGGNENLKMLDRSVVDLEPYEKLKVDTTDDSHIGNNSSNTNSTVESNPESKPQEDNKVESKPESKPSVDNEEESKPESKPSVDNDVESKPVSKPSVDNEVESEPVSKPIVDNKVESKPETESNISSELESTEDTDTNAQSIPETQIESIPQTQSDSNVGVIEETIITNIIEKQEVITKQPDEIVKQTTSTENVYQIPWLMLILSSVAMVLLATGVIVVFVIIDKKKTKKNNDNNIN